jgi:hypothetical protein
VHRAEGIDHCALINSTVTHNTAENLLGSGGRISGCVPTLVNSVVADNFPDNIN